MGQVSGSNSCCHVAEINNVTSCLWREITDYMRRLSTGDFTGRATMVMLGGCQKSSEQCTARRCRFVTGSKPGLGNVPLRKAAARPSRVRRQSGKQFVPENWLSNCVSSNSATISSTVATSPRTSSSISSGDCLNWTARLDQWIRINRTYFNINFYNVGHMVPCSNLSQWCVTSVSLRPSSRRLKRAGADVMMQVDPWGKAAECERAMAIVADPERRVILSKLRSVWVALGNKQSFLDASEGGVPLSTIVQIHTELISGCKNAMH